MLREPGPGGPQGNDRDCAVRPGHIQSQIVATDTCSGLASSYNLRYPKSVTFCAQGGRRLPARAFVPRPDTAWVGTGTAFGAAAAKRRCTLLAVWYVEQEEPWIILTDLPPEEVGVSWYALRFYHRIGLQGGQEPGHGTMGPKTRRTDPARVSRHWLVLSVATLARPWPMGPGSGRRQRAQDCPGQSPDASQGPAVPAPLPLAEAGRRTGQRDPPRHRLAAAVACSGQAARSGAATSGSCPNGLAGNPNCQPGGHPPCPCLKTPYIPLSALGAGIELFDENDPAVTPRCLAIEASSLPSSH